MLPSCPKYERREAREAKRAEPKNGLPPYKQEGSLIPVFGSEPKERIRENRKEGERKLENSAEKNKEKAGLPYCQKF